jgi:preprotein translocase SecE subunit
MKGTARNLLALLLAVVFACSLFTVGAFAAEETTAAAEETTVAEEVTTEAATEATTEGATTEEATTKAADDHEGHDHENEGKNFWQKNFMRKNAEGKEVLYVTKIVVWGLVIAGLIAGVVFCIVKREVAVAYLRALNSEKKRIVWSSWKETRKNTLVVLAVVAAITLVIFLFNMVLEKIFGGASTGGDLWFQKSLLELIRGLFP